MASGPGLERGRGDQRIDYSQSVGSCVPFRQADCSLPNVLIRMNQRRGVVREEGSNRPDFRGSPASLQQFQHRQRANRAVSIRQVLDKFARTMITPKVPDEYVGSEDNDSNLADLT